MAIPGDRERKDRDYSYDRHDKGSTADRKDTPNVVVNRWGNGRQNGRFVSLEGHAPSWP
jgi:hypothetical protein